MKLNLKLLIHFSLFLFEISSTEKLKCEPLKQPDNGYFVGGTCSNELENACAIRCKIGYKQYGSSYRKCLSQNATWSGWPTRCEIIKCKPLNRSDPNLELNCSKDFKSTLNYDLNEYGTKCYINCANGFRNIGSSVRYCLPLGVWSGLEAKCKKIKKYKPTTGLATKTTTPDYETYEDLSNKTLSFDYSFSKIDLVINIKNLPITFISWFRTKFTTNIKIFQYIFECNEILILTDSNSSIYLNINKIYNYRLSKNLIRNDWTQIAFIQTDSLWQLYLDGSLQVDILELKLVSKCESDQSETKNENEFKIIDSKLGEKYHSIRGDLTRTYLYNTQLSEETLLKDLFICEKISNVSLAFDWSNLLINNYLRKFKRKSNGFCVGCSNPDFVRHAIINYQGSRTGDFRWYKCLHGYKMIGFASSVCLVHGSWSNKTPKCLYVQL